MRKQRIILICVVLVLLLAGWLALQFAQNREPRYQNRTLTQWLTDYSNAQNSETDTNSPTIIRASTNAVRQIGMRAIPFLLRKVSAQPAFIEKVFDTFALWQFVTPLGITDHRLPPHFDRTLGHEGFRILGHDAIGALPALVKLTKHPDSDVRYMALRSIMRLKPPPEALLPILQATIHDPEKELIGEMSAHLLRRLSPEEAEKAGIYKEFPWMSRPYTVNNATNASVAK
jgi:hypothetical protein